MTEELVIIRQSAAGRSIRAGQVVEVCRYVAGRSTKVPYRVTALKLLPRHLIAKVEPLSR